MCYEKSTGKPEQAECLRKVVKKARDLLEDSYASSLTWAKTVDKDTGGTHKVEENLKASHAKFKEYLEAECNYVYSTYTTGTGGGDAYTGCLIDTIVERLD